MTEKINSAAEAGASDQHNWILDCDPEGAGIPVILGTVQYLKNWLRTARSNYSIPFHGVPWNEVIDRWVKRPTDSERQQHSSCITTDEQCTVALERVRKIATFNPPEGSELYQDLIRATESALDYIWRKSDSD